MSNSKLKTYMKWILIGLFCVTFAVVTILLINYEDKGREPYPISDNDYFKRSDVVEILTTTGEFSLSDYEEFIELFPCDKVVEPIQGRQDAKTKGLNLIMEEFGELNGKPYDPLKYSKLATYYDSETECWLIQGLSHPELTSEEPGVIIRQNGDVLAIFYS